MNDTPDIPQSTGRDLIRLQALRTHEIRVSVMSSAIALANAFTEQRAQLQAQSAGEFVSLVLMVRGRNENRSVQITWVNLHFRQGKRTGMTSLPKPRSSRDYDLASLKRATPEWLHELVVETEKKARLLRDALASLTTIDRELKVISSRLSGIDRMTDLPSPDTTIDLPENEHGE